MTQRCQLYESHSLRLRLLIAITWTMREKQTAPTVLGSGSALCEIRHRTSQKAAAGTTIHWASGESPIWTDPCQRRSAAVSWPTHCRKPARRSARAPARWAYPGDRPCTVRPRLNRGAGRHACHAKLRPRRWPRPSGPILSSARRRRWPSLPAARSFSSPSRAGIGWRVSQGLARPCGKGARVGSGRLYFGGLP